MDYTIDQVANTYGLPKGYIRKTFPRAKMIRVPGRGCKHVWTEQQVQKELAKGPTKALWQAEMARRKSKQQEENAKSILIAATMDSYIEKAKHLNRNFVLHVGPTNSGKTYTAIEDLKQHRPGVYLGPLRLLALEMSDKINGAGIPCSMVTGEETNIVQGAEITSSTIELCDYSKHYSTAVIDEAQLIADPSRGSAWMKALCLVDAEMVHVCMAPEALDFIVQLVESFDADYVVKKHERLTPLKYAGVCNGIKDIRDGDALICFSRKSVLSTAAQLERRGFKASVIYGSLPPQARRNEVEKYLNGTNTVVVATDAIGLGISLPIKRIVFTETEKFDGTERRQLNTAEIKQIAGRAGRFGYNEKGEVLTFDEKPFVAKALTADAKPIKQACVGFPKEALQSDCPIDDLLKAWQHLPKSKLFIREDMSEAMVLYGKIKKMVTRENKALVFDLITCPVDIKSPELIIYWARCAAAVIKNRPIPVPEFGDSSLQACELQYRAYDVYHQMLRRAGMDEPDDAGERERVCKKIDTFMRASKEQYIRRCDRCGKVLKIGYTFKYCEKCYAARGEFDPWVQ